MVKPGGILIIDHRNYDYILETGRAPQGKNIYYKVMKETRLKAEMIILKRLIDHYKEPAKVVDFFKFFL